jgi:hypothetical protein
MLTNIRGPERLSATEILKTYSFSFNESVTDTERKPRRKVAAVITNNCKINQTTTQHMIIGKMCPPDGAVN